MRQNIQQRKSEGFTIIEVMIVLAIAGLIMLIVFLAVPALQRNSRNTAIKNDASAVAAAISEFESNNDGAAPGYLSQSGATVTFQTSSSVAGNTAVAKVGGSTTVNAVSTTNMTTSSTFAASNVYPVKGFNCAGTASSRSFAVWYGVEASSGVKGLCIDS